MDLRTIREEGFPYPVRAIENDGRCEVQEVLDDLYKDDPDVFWLLNIAIDELAKQGINARDCRFKWVKFKIAEIKVNYIRLFYFVYGGEAILTNSCEKGDKKKQTRAIDEAHQIRAKYLKIIRSKKK